MLETPHFAHVHIRVRDVNMSFLSTFKGANAISAKTID